MLGLLRENDLVGEQPMSIIACSRPHASCLAAGEADRLTRRHPSTKLQPELEPIRIAGRGIIRS
jgi:hypothetical protein